MEKFSRSRSATLLEGSAGIGALTIYFDTGHHDFKKKSKGSGWTEYVVYWSALELKRKSLVTVGWQNADAWIMLQVVDTLSLARSASNGTGNGANPNRRALTTDVQEQLLQRLEMNR